MDCWERSVRHALASARSLGSPVLTGTFPLLLDRLCEVLTPMHDRTDIPDLLSLGAEHGYARAALTDYDDHAVLTEFAIFRRVVFETLDEHDIPVRAGARRMLHTLLDRTVQQSVGSFLDTADRLRKEPAQSATHTLAFPLEECDLLELVAAVAGRAGRAAPVHVSGARARGFWSRHALERAVLNLLHCAARSGGQGASLDAHLAVREGRVTLTLHGDGAGSASQPDGIGSGGRSGEGEAGAPAPDAMPGLSFVREVAHGHCGSLIIYREEPGTSFVLDLPLDARPIRRYGRGPALAAWLS